MSGAKPGASEWQVHDQDDTPYRAFALVYDETMSAVPYGKWIDYVERLVRRHSLKVRDVLDLACGTGNTAIPWAERGYNVTGVDGSSDMLSVAHDKVQAHGLNLPLYCQDMRELDLGRQFDLVTCLYDSMNYLLQPDDLVRVFQRVAKHVRTDGAFIFDMNSQNKLASIRDKVMHLSGVGWHLIWDEGFRHDLDLWEVNLTGFIEASRSDELYRLFEETHQERGYPISQVCRLLQANGFGPVDTYRAFSQFRADESCDRVYYVARR